MWSVGKTTTSMYVHTALLKDESHRTFLLSIKLGERYNVTVTSIHAKKKTRKTRFIYYMYVLSKTRGNVTPFVHSIQVLIAILHLICPLQ